MIHPTLPERRVKRGFNWTAMIFGTVWAYSEGLLIQGGRMTTVDAAAALLCLRGQPAFLIAALLLFLTKNFYCARHGNAWLGRHLRDQGYREAP